MKIGIDISQIVFEGTGVATYTDSLVRALAQIDRTNNYLLFGASLRRREKLKQFSKEIKDINPNFDSRIVYLPPTAMNKFWNEWHALPIEHFTGKLDVFHTSDWTEPSSHCPKVTTIHDLLVYRFPEFSQERSGFRLKTLEPVPSIVNIQKKKLSWVKKESKLVIADSEATKEDCIGLLGIPEEKIRVIHLAAPEIFSGFSRKTTAEKELELQRVRTKYHLGQNYILSLGTREPRKNLERLVAAYTGLRPKDTDLVIGGKYGWGEDVAALGDGIKILGYVPEEDLPAMYYGAGVFVYPSLYEGFGVPVLEAMHSGCPVITSDVGSLPEVGGPAAVYVKPLIIDDIMEKIALVLALSPGKRRGIITEGKKWAQKFSWKSTAEKTLGVYEELGKK